MDNDEQRLAISEDKMRLLFAEFRLELLKELSQYATVTQFDKFREEVTLWRREMETRVRTVEDSNTGDIAVGFFKRWFLIPVGLTVFTAAITVIAAAISGHVL